MSIKEIWTTIPSSFYESRSWVTVRLCSWGYAWGYALEELSKQGYMHFNLMSSLNPITQVAGPYVPQFEIYWKKLDPENTGKVMFVHWKKVLGRLSKPLYSIKVMWTSTNMFQGGSHGCCTISQALRPLRPDFGQGEEKTMCWKGGHWPVAAIWYWLTCSVVLQDTILQMYL